MTETLSTISFYFPTGLLHKALGSNNEKDVEPRSPERKNTLETNLQLAYQDIYFRDTQLYLNIVEWESNNHLKFLRVDI